MNVPIHARRATSRFRIPRLAATVAIVLSVLAGAGLHADRASAANGLVPLYRWWSSGTGDNLTTTDPAMAATSRGERRGAYAFVGVEGYVFDPARPQPPGTRELYRWFNSTRGDSFMTTNRTWASETPGEARAGYVFQRMDGFVLDTPRAGTRQLSNWWDPNREDNFLTTEPEWAGREGDRSGDYTMFLVEGYAVSPSGTEDFGFGSVTARSENPSANAVRALGSRPLLAVAFDYDGLSLRHTKDYFDRLLFGPGFPNVADYFRENSYRQFTWRPAAVLRLPYPGTRSVASLRGNYSVGAEAVRQAAHAGFCFRDYDRDRNGVVTADELAVIWFGATPAADEFWGQTVVPRQFAVSEPEGCGVFVAPTTTGVPEDAALTLIAHELTHQLGAAHVYGACSCMSDGLTVMGSSLDPGDNGTFHLDPFTKIQLGWIKPRVYAATSPAASTVLAAPQSLVPTEPVILYDPRRGRNEYFILEFRTPTATSYDANVADALGGVAVWFVKTDGAGALTNVPAQINAGADGLQTFASPSDMLVDTNGDGRWDQIVVGADDRLDSVASPFDQVAFDVSNWIIGSPPDVPAAGFRGQSSLWRSSHGEFLLRWLDGTDSTFRLRVGAGVSFPTPIDVQWRSTARALPSARVDELRGAVGAPGSTVVVAGDFGVQQSTRIASLAYPLGSRDLEIVRWSATQLTVRVPAGTPAGTYQLVVYDDATRSVASNRLPFTVVTL